MPARGSLNRRLQSITWSNRYHLLTPRPLRLFQYDYPQPAQRLVYLSFLQQAEGCPHISRACTVREKHSSREREYTALESLSSDDTLRVSILTKKEPEPGNAICVTISHKQNLLKGPRARKTSRPLGYSILRCRGGAVAWLLQIRRAWCDRMRLRFGRGRGSLVGPMNEVR